MFGSVTNADVAEALALQGYEFDRRKVSLSEPIKRLGEYSASVRLHPEVTATIKIVVDPEVSSKDGARQ